MTADTYVRISPHSDVPKADIKLDSDSLCEHRRIFVQFQDFL